MASLTGDGDAAVVRFAQQAGGAPPGWYPDPSGRHQLRYWDQGEWTGHVSNEGATAVDQV